MVVNTQEEFAALPDGTKVIYCEKEGYKYFIPNTKYQYYILSDESSFNGGHLDALNLAARMGLLFKCAYAIDKRISKLNIQVSDKINKEQEIILW